MNENKEKTAGNLANSVVEGYDYSVAVRIRRKCFADLRQILSLIVQT